MKKIINKKTKSSSKITKKQAIKKIKSVAKVAVKKTKVFLKKAGKKAGNEAGKMAKSLQKKWKSTEPKREQFKKEMGEAAKKAGVRSVELLKSGLKNSLKIGDDIANVVKKDLNEMRGGGKDKK